MYIIRKYYTILCMALEYPQEMGIGWGGSWNQSYILRDHCTQLWLHIRIPGCIPRDQFHQNHWGWDPGIAFIIVPLDDANVQSIRLSKYMFLLPYLPNVKYTSTSLLSMSKLFALQKENVVCSIPIFKKYLIIYLWPYMTQKHMCR